MSTNRNGYICILIPDEIQTQHRKESLFFTNSSRESCSCRSTTDSSQQLHVCICSNQARPGLKLANQASHPLHQSEEIRFDIYRNFKQKRSKNGDLPRIFTCFTAFSEQFLAILCSLAHSCWILVRPRLFQTCSKILG